MLDRRRYWSIFALVVVAYVAVLWIVDVLPCQDLPQHLAYARIFRDYGSTSVRFEEFYTLPDHVEPYYTVYFLLAGLGRFMSIDAAARVVLSVFVAGSFLALHYLVDAAHRDGKRELRDPAWPALLGGAVAFGPTTAMGFLAFMLTIPLFLAAAGALVGFMGEHRRRSDPIVLAVCALALPSLHVIAAGMFLLFVGAMLVRRRPDWKKGAFAALLTLGAVFVWGRLGGVGVGHANALDVKDAFSRGQGFDSLTILFRFSWSDPPTLLNYGMWSVFGPYRFDAIALMIVALAIAIFVAQRPWKTTAAPSACKRAAILFAIVSAVVPWGMYAPSEATFINLRMMTLAVGLLVTLLPPAWFEARRPRLALVGLSMFMTLSFAHHAIGFSRESRSATALIERVPDNAVLMSLPYHDKTEHFGRLFRLTHFLPMYYTVRSGGINTQFWANYTEHLPVGYRRGKRPHHTPDWQPDKFEPSHLVASDYLLVQSPTASDPDATRKAHASAKQTIERQAETVACDGLWCLYRLQHDTSAQR